MLHSVSAATHRRDRATEVPSIQTRLPAVSLSVLLCAVGNTCAAPCADAQPRAQQIAVPELPFDIWAYIYNLRAAMTIQAYFRGHIVRKGPLYFVKLYVRRVPRTATGSWRLAAIRANWFHTIQSARAMM